MPEPMEETEIDAIAVEGKPGNKFFKAVNMDTSALGPAPGA
jgi:hypothetical protein